MSELTTAKISKLETAAGTAIDAARPMDSLDALTVPLPVWQPRIEPWRAELSDGLGVVVLRGLPVRQWGAELSSYAYWILGHHLGTPGAQNPDGELLGHVLDYGEADRPMVPKYRTAGDIVVHCDSADVVGLLCLRTAKEGGQSRIANSVAIYDILADETPELAAELIEPFAIDRRGEEGASQRGWFDIAPRAWDGTRLRTFWHSDYMRSAERHDDVEFSLRRRAAIEAFGEIAARPDTHVDMWLEARHPAHLQSHSGPRSVAVVAQSVSATSSR
ncbi:MAG: TauD/TfdA family dioxygenase [Ilumatobacteraceae bacterium]|nr:TauD/TfdA family dioxygenase [Ilumatobacteraceae bacterium]